MPKIETPPRSTAADEINRRKHEDGYFSKQVNAGIGCETIEWPDGRRPQPDAGRDQDTSYSSPASAPGHVTGGGW